MHAIAYFTSIYMHMNLKLKWMVQKVFILSKRFLGIPYFFYFALTNGILKLLKKANTCISTNKVYNPTGTIILNLLSN